MTGVHHTCAICNCISSSGEEGGVVGVLLEGNRRGLIKIQNGKSTGREDGGGEPERRETHS